MPLYDSDSSVDEDFTLTSVLLGYAAKEAKDDEISQLGGRPTWLDPSFPPSAALARCKICNCPMVLLLQLNGELPDFPGHERRLYVLSCRRKACRRREGSVRVVRGIRMAEVLFKEKKTKPVEASSQTQPSKPDIKIGESLFGAKLAANSSSGNPFSNGRLKPPSNPFSTSSTIAPNNSFTSSSLQTSKVAAIPPQSQSTPFDLRRTFDSALTLNNEAPAFGPSPPPEPWPPESDLPPAYPLYYLDPDYEELDKIEDLPIPTQTMDIEEGSGFGSQREEKDAYEDTIDKTFQKFADRLAQNPEQVIRYEFKGQPLLYSKTDMVGKLLSGAGRVGVHVTTSSGSTSRMPRCSNCGAARVFEVQLTPHAIAELEREESGLDGMEWGTIIVGVCEEDCQQKGVKSGVGYVEEWVGVQWEELGDRR